MTLFLQRTLSKYLLRKRKEHKKIKETKEIIKSMRNKAHRYRPIILYVAYVHTHARARAHTLTPHTDTHTHTHTHTETHGRYNLCILEELSFFSIKNWLSKLPACVFDSLYKTKRVNAKREASRLSPTNFGMCQKKHFSYGVVKTMLNVHKI